MHNDLTKQTMDDTPKKPSLSKTSIAIQIIYSGIAACPLILGGCAFGFSAIALPYMKEPNEIVHVDADQASWIASMTTISTPFGCLLSSYLVDRFGRRRCLMYSNLFAIFGWLFIGVSPDLSRIYFGRVLKGLSVGILSPLPVMYITELASPTLRGFLCTFGSLAIATGVVIVYGLSLILHENWMMISNVCCVLAIIFCCTAWVLPESPIWLMNKGRYEEARQDLMRFRFTELLSDVEDEIEAIASKARSSKQKKLSIWNALKAMKKPEAYKPVLIMNAYLMFQQISGCFVVIFYATDLAMEAGVTVDPFIAAMMLGVARLVFVIVAGLLSNKYGRRACSLVSGLGMAVSLGVISVYLQSNDAASYDHTFDRSLNGTTTESGAVSRLLPISCLVIYIIMCTIGFLTIPWAMCSEMFSSEIRGVAGGLAMFVVYVTSSVVLKLYPVMLEVFNKHGLFYFYSAASLLGTIFVYYFLPETQGRTLMEIEEIFKKGIPARKTKVKTREPPWTSPERIGNLRIEGEKLLEPVPSTIFQMQEYKSSGL